MVHCTESSTETNDSEDIGGHIVLRAFPTTKQLHSAVYDFRTALREVLGAQDVNKNLKAKFEYYQVKPTVNELLLLTFVLCSSHSLVCSLCNMNR